MAIEKTFYEEICNKEKLWIDLINRNLLNIFYIKMELKPFYNEKLENLKSEYNLTHSSMINQVIEEVTHIMNKIVQLEMDSNYGKRVDIKSLIPLFLLSKFTNTNKQNDLDDLEIQRREIRKQVLKAINRHYTEEISDDKVDEFLYDNFYDNVDPLTK